MLHYAHDDFYEKKGDGYRMKPSNEGRFSKMKDWMLVEITSIKGTKEKLLRISSVISIKEVDNK